MYRLADAFGRVHDRHTWDSLALGKVGYGYNLLDFYLLWSIGLSDRGSRINTFNRKNQLRLNARKSIRLNTRKSIHLNVRLKHLNVQESIRLNVTIDLN